MDVDTFLLDTRRTGSSLSNASRRYRHGHFAGLQPPGINLSPDQLFSMYLSVRLFPVFRAPGQCDKWNVIKGASAWFRLSCLSLPLLLLLLCSALPVACHDTHRAVRAPRGTNSSSPALVGRHVRSYNHLMGDVHKRKLFSFQKFFLRINKNGKVKGTKSKDDPYSE